MRVRAALDVVATLLLIAAGIVVLRNQSGTRPVAESRSTAVTVPTKPVAFGDVVKGSPGATVGIIERRFHKDVSDQVKAEVLLQSLEQLAEENLSVPLWAGIDERSQERVVSVIRAAAPVPS